MKQRILVVIALKNQFLILIGSGMKIKESMFVAVAEKFNRPGQYALPLQLFKEDDMGYSTTITISNDAADLVLKHKKEFAEKVYEAMSNLSEQTLTLRLGNHANAIMASKAQHDDVQRLYYVGRGMMIELTPYFVQSYIQYNKYNFRQARENRAEIALQCIEHALERLKTSRKQVKEIIKELAKEKADEESR